MKKILTRQVNSDIQSSQLVNRRFFSSFLKIKVIGQYISLFVLVFSLFFLSQRGYIYAVDNPPTAPLNLLATVGDGQVALDWDTPSSDGGFTITDYVIEYKVSANSTWLTFNDGVSTTTNATVTGLTNGLSYDFRVKALNESGTEAARTTAVVDLFENGASADIGFMREDISTAETYWFLQHLGSGKYWSIALRNNTSGDGATIHILRNSLIRILMVNVDDTDGSVSTSGTGWSTLTEALSYGGSYRRNETTNSSVTFTTPANTTRVGTIANHTTNAGATKVLIDGDATRATKLPTAQQLVDGGVLAGTVLVANGGTLNPTDRILNQYTTSADHNTTTLLADDLTAGVHTVQLVVTGYKQGASSGVRLYITGFLYGTDTTTLSTSNIRFLTTYTIFDQSSAYEYAISYQPGGSGVTTFVGNGHGYDRETAFIVLVDGSPTTLTNGQIVDAASTAKVTRTSNIRHPSTSTTTQANSTVDYEMFSDTGLKMTTTIAWQGSSLIRAAYVSMYPSNTGLDKGSNSALSTDVTLTANDDAQVANGKGKAIYLWDSDDYYGALQYLPSLSSVANWQYTGSLYHSIQDRSDGIHKIYLSRVQDDVQESVTSSTTWNSVSYFKVGYFTAGTDESLEKGNISIDTSIETGAAVTLSNVILDTTAPVISSVGSSTTSSGATITWLTDENSSSLVEYGTSTSYGTSTTETDTSTRVTSHSVALSGLSSCTTYHYRVKSTDSASNQGTGADNTFNTAGCTSSNSSSSSSSTSSSPSAPVCSAQAPGSKAPWLYGAIPQSGNSILLYFTEADNPVDTYALEFGTKPGEYSFGATNIGGKGSRTYLVQSLTPNTTYYFRVRGGNGCAPGAWSNELSAKTMSLISFNNLQFTSSELDEVVTTPSSNVDTSKPSSETQDDETETAPESEITQVSETEGYIVNIKVTDTNKQAVGGAKVTMHSKVQETTTDENGIARFTNVEPGDHKVFIAYNGFEGEQSLNLTGDVKEFNLNVTVEAENVLLAPQVLIGAGVLLFIIVVLFILLMRARSK